MTLFLIVLIVFLCVWFSDVDKRSKRKYQKLEEEKQRNNINIPLQKEIEKKYFDLILDVLRKADKEKRLYAKSILDIIESTYDNYGIPYENETWLSGKTRTHYREDNYKEYKRDIYCNFGIDYDKLDKVDFFKNVSLEQLIFNEKNPIITKLACSDYLFGEPKSRKYFDETGIFIRACNLDTCEHYQEFYPSSACIKCSKYNTFLDYDCFGRCKAFTNTTAARLIAEFVYRATKKELYYLGYSYSRATRIKDTHNNIASTSVVINEKSDEKYPWLYKNPPLPSKKNKNQYNYTFAFEIVFYAAALAMFIILVVFAIIKPLPLTIVGIIVYILIVLAMFFSIYTALKFTKYRKSQKNTKK